MTRGSYWSLHMPSHYLNQCWNIVDWTLWNKLQWNLNQNIYIFIKENASENAVWKMAAILSRSQCVKHDNTLSLLNENVTLLKLMFGTVYHSMTTVAKDTRGDSSADCTQRIYAACCVGTVVDRSRKAGSQPAARNSTWSTVNLHLHWILQQLLGPFIWAYVVSIYYHSVDIHLSLTIFVHGPFGYRWLKGYIYSSCYYNHQIGSIHLSHCFHIFSVVMCLRCWLYHIMSLIVYTFRENLEFVFISIVQFMMSANSRIRFGLQIVFVWLYITPSNYHHCANFIWRH